MMQTIKSKNKITFNSADDSGEYEVRIALDPTLNYLQLQMHTRDGEVYANTGRKELTAIRDMINTVLEEIYEKANMEECAGCGERKILKSENLCQTCWDKLP